jgi:hypothetical protein
MNNDKTAPIFIMSSERSGSNLLRTLLSNHSHISGPTAAQFLPVFSERALYYTPLSDKERALDLMKDMLAVVNHPYYNWGLTLDLDDAYERCRPRVFLDFFDLFYREKCIHQSKRRFICKENNLFDFAFQLIEYYDDPKFIYLHRDPRDYAASFMNVPAGFKTAYTAAMNWRQEQKKCRVLVDTFGMPVHRVRYRDLISEVEKTMRGILTFLEEESERACYQVQTEKNESLTHNVYWKNLARPILKSNTGKYRQQFSTDEVKVIETVAREPMLRLGYAFDTQVDWKKGRFFRLRHALTSRLHRFQQRTAHAETYQVLSSRNQLIKAITQKRREEWTERLSRDKN